MALPPEDILAIQKLLADYNHLIDSGRGEEWAALFLDDALLDTGVASAKGKAELIEFGQTVPTMAPGIRHLLTNVTVDGEGDEATAAAYVQVWMAAEQASESTMIFSGVYSDNLRRVDGQWRFANRSVDVDGPRPIGSA